MEAEVTVGLWDEKIPLRCPNCNRALAPLPVYRDMSKIPVRTCPGCHRRWTIWEKDSCRRVTHVFTLIEKPKEGAPC